MLSNRLKELRRERGLTLEEVAAAVGTSRQTIHRYENGIITNIPPEKVESLAGALGTTPSSLMGWSSDEAIAKYANVRPITTKKLPMLGEIACGNPIYATGDGIVTNVKFELFGYGNQVVIDHGFGYKTRYAHMKTIGVVEGMKVKRGECIGLSGNSGRSSGPHLHYEVIYKDRHVNPANYYDLTITPEEYATMVQNTADASQKITLHPSHRKRRK